MLTREQVRDLEIEERLRFEIREALQNSRDTRVQSRVWRFLNSAFGLFLCSSIALAGISTLYNWYRARDERQAAARAEIAQISIELDYRVRQIEFWRGRLAIDQSDTPEISVWRIVVGDVVFRPTAPQFAGFHAYGLVYRLQALGVKANSRDALSAIVDIENLGRRTDWRYQQGSLDPSLQALKRYRDSLLKFVEGSNR